MSDISQAEMDKYFETGGKEVPPAIVEAEKEVPEPGKPVEKPVEKPIDKPVEVEKPEGEVQVNVQGKMVPLSELMEERKTRQEWQTTAAAQQQQLTEALNLMKQRAPKAEENEVTPDPNTDPMGYLAWGFNKLQQQTSELANWRQQTQQQQQVTNQTQQVLNWASQQASAYTAKQTDYPDAYKFASESRDKEYQALGFNDPTVRAQLIEQDTARVINHAAQNNLNPAELIYNFAKARGFKAEIVAAQKKVPDLDDKVRNINKGQEAAKGLSGTSGGAPSEISNLQDLAAASGDMSDEEFSKAFDKIAPKMKGKYV